MHGKSFSSLRLWDHTATYDMVAPSTVVKLSLSGHEPDRLPQSTAKVKKAWSCPSTPSFAFVAGWSITYIKNFS
jgi:hypothetical protein